MANVQLRLKLRLEGRLYISDSLRSLATKIAEVFHWYADPALNAQENFEKMRNEVTNSLELEITVGRSLHIRGRLMEVVNDP